MPDFAFNEGANPAAIAAAQGAVEWLNREYQVEDYAPGLVLFGSNAGGEASAFDTRNDAAPIVTVPFTGMELRYATPVAPDIDALLASAYATRRRTNPNLRGMEIFEIKPIILGGDPVDPKNKTALTRRQHIEAVKYWNALIRSARAGQTAT